MVCVCTFVYVVSTYCKMYQIVVKNGIFYLSKLTHRSVLSCKVDREGSTDALLRKAESAANVEKQL